MKKRGRKSGSVSFIQVPLQELNAVLKPNAKVIVWGRYANMLGLSGSPIEAKHDVLISSVQSATTEFEIDDFGQEMPAPQNAETTTQKDHKDTEDLQLKPSIQLDIF